MIPDNSTYKAVIVCPNCGRCNEIKIPRGTIVKDHLRLVSIACEECFMRLNSSNIKPHPHY